MEELRAVSMMRNIKPPDEATNPLKERTLTSDTRERQDQTVSPIPGALSTKTLYAELGVQEVGKAPSSENGSIDRFA